MRAAAPWAVGLAGLCVAGLIAWIVYGTSVLGVTEVRVGGTAILGPDQVRAAAAVAPGTPLARVDLDAVRDRVAALAPVAQVTVARDWPRAVRISVVERTAVAIVPKEKEFQLIDRTGVVFHTVAERPPDLPLVRLGQPGPRDPTTRAALQVLAALTPKLRERLAELVAEKPARIRLLLTDKRTVIWGDATENETKANVATVLLDRQGTEIDVSAPHVVTVR